MPSPDPAPIATAPQSAHARVPWPDVARGACVCLVVLMHVHILHAVHFFGDAPGFGLVTRAVAVMVVLRLPVFFVVSGFLSAGLLRRGWPEGLRRRVMPVAYLLVVWLAITSIYLQLRAWLVEGWQFDGLGSFLRQLIWPESVLWYLWALVVFFLVARATRRVPTWLVLAVAVVAALAAPSFPGLLGDLMRSFPFFIAGTRLAKPIRSVTARTRWPLAILGLAVWIACDALGRTTDHGTAAIQLVASVAAVCLVLAMLPGVSEWVAFTPLRFVGRHTLVIFVLHPIMIIALNDLLQHAAPDLVPWIASLPMSGLVYPIVIAAAIVLASLGVEWLLRRCHLAFLVEFPWRWRPARPLVHVDG